MPVVGGPQTGNHFQYSGKVDTWGKGGSFAAIGGSCSNDSDYGWMCKYKYVFFMIKRFLHTVNTPKQYPTGSAAEVLSTLLRLQEAWEEMPPSTITFKPMLKLWVMISFR